MLKQDEHMKMEKFIETMHTIIQTHLIIEPNWAEVTKKAKNLKHIIWRCDPLATAPLIITGGGAVPGFIHTSHNPKIKTLTVSLSHLKAQKVKEERNQEETN